MVLVNNENINLSYIYDILRISKHVYKTYQKGQILLDIIKFIF